MIMQLAEDLKEIRTYQQHVLIELLQVQINTLC